jgi:hypothetical protein|tara:strand:- start:294 stop:488 length:195 start_codon:yes stop_codon:yes gene_type:complete
MKKYLSLVVGIIGIGYLINTFFGNQSPIVKFGFEINIWIQRLFFVICILGFFSLYYSEKKRIEK